MTGIGNFPLYLIPLLPFIGAAINLLFGKRLSKGAVSLIACLAVGAAAVIAIHVTFGELLPLWKQLRAGNVSTAKIVWNGWEWLHAGESTRGEAAFSINAALMLDPLSAVMILVITIIGFLIHLYSVGYMAHEERYSRYFGYLNLFTGAMLILVLGDSLPVMFVGWEGVGLCSYLLIGFWFEKDAYASAGKKAFIVNRIGDFAFLAGIFLTYHFTKTMSFEGMAAFAQSSDHVFTQKFWGATPAFWIGLCFFIGACGKSAQLPLYVWLPDAMAGPTPVSALIHAATMVTAGVYMIARLSFVYAFAPKVLMIVGFVGAATALFAAIIGFAQNDMKKVLAYSTVSQLGLMFVGVGTGNMVGGVFHLMTHAFFKAGLFLGAGSVMHAMSGSGDITKMGGLRKLLPYTHATFLIYCLAIAGVPLLSGFFSKDFILAGAWGAKYAGWPAYAGKLIWVLASLASLCTAIYMFRLYFLVFSGESRADEETKQHIHESPSEMWAPLVILAIGSVAVGYVGLPGVVSKTNQFGSWLAPSVGQGMATLGFKMPSHSAEWALMAAATASALVGILIAYLLWGGGYRPAVVSLDRSLGRFGNLVRNKFYVDEAYEVVLVKPFKWLCHAIYWVVDHILIDKVLVGFPVLLVDFAGRGLRLFQNGDVQRYITGFAIGVALILFFGSRPSPSFRVDQSDGDLSLTLQANAASYGPKEQPHLEYSWKCDGHTKEWTRGEANKTCSYNRPGSYRVSLRVRDALWGTSRSSSKLVRVGGGE